VAAILEAAPGLGVRVVRARIHEDNARSARLLASLDFRRCEVLSDFTIRPGVTRTCVMFERMVDGT
jgi:RimJ/RimL family protein N-acetyltransferase